MKKFRAARIFAIVLICALLFSGCAAMVQKFENPELRQDTEAMLNALTADDFEGAYSLVRNLCTEAEFAPAYDQMRSLVAEAENYTLTLLSVSSNTNITNGDKVSTTQAVYNMESDLGRIIISVSSDSKYGLTSFWLTPFEETDYYFTGTLPTMAKADAGQWILLLSNLITIGFAVFALIDCCRHKFRKKITWILLIVLGFVTFGTTIGAAGFRTTVNIGWLTAYSALIRYGSGTFTFRLMIPCGAIAYFIARRSLLKSLSSGQAPEETKAFPEESQQIDP